MKTVLTSFIVLVLIFISVMMYFVTGGSVVIRKTELTPTEDKCLEKLLPVAFAQKTQKVRIVLVTKKDEKKIYTRVWTAGEIGTEWFVECPSKIGRVKS